MGRAACDLYLNLADDGGTSAARQPPLPTSVGAGHSGDSGRDGGGSMLREGGVSTHEQSICNSQPASQEKEWDDDEVPFSCSQEATGSQEIDYVGLMEHSAPTLSNDCVCEPGAQDAEDALDESMHCDANDEAGQRPCSSFSSVRSRRPAANAAAQEEGRPQRTKTKPNDSRKEDRSAKRLKASSRSNSASSSSGSARKLNSRSNSASSSSGSAKKLNSRSNSGSSLPGGSTRKSCRGCKKVACNCRVVVWSEPQLDLATGMIVTLKQEPDAPESQSQTSTSPATLASPLPWPISNTPMTAIAELQHANPPPPTRTYIFMTSELTSCLPHWETAVEMTTVGVGVKSEPFECRLPLQEKLTGTTGFVKQEGVKEEPIKREQVKVELLATCSTTTSQDLPQSSRAEPGCAMHGTEEAAKSVAEQEPHEKNERCGAKVRNQGCARAGQVSWKNTFVNCKKRWQQHQDQAAEQDAAVVAIFSEQVRFGQEANIKHQKMCLLYFIHICYHRAIIKLPLSCLVTNWGGSERTVTESQRFHDSFDSGFCGIYAFCVIDALLFAQELIDLCGEGRPDSTVNGIFRNATTGSGAKKGVSCKGGGFEPSEKVVPRWENAKAGKCFFRHDVVHGKVLDGGNFDVQIHW